MIEHLARAAVELHAARRSSSQHPHLSSPKRWMGGGTSSSLASSSPLHHRNDPHTHHALHTKTTATATNSSPRYIGSTTKNKTTTVSHRSKHSNATHPPPPPQSHIIRSYKVPMSVRFLKVLPINRVSRMPPPKRGLPNPLSLRPLPQPIVVVSVRRIATTKRRWNQRHWQVVSMPPGRYSHRRNEEG